MGQQHSGGGTFYTSGQAVNHHLLPQQANTNAAYNTDHVDNNKSSNEYSHPHHPSSSSLIHHGKALWKSAKTTMGASSGGKASTMLGAMQIRTASAEAAATSGDSAEAISSRLRLLQFRDLRRRSMPTHSLESSPPHSSTTITTEGARVLFGSEAALHVEKKMNKLQDGGMSTVKVCYHASAGDGLQSSGEHHEAAGQFSSTKGGMGARNGHSSSAWAISQFKARPPPRIQINGKMQLSAVTSLGFTEDTGAVLAAEKSSIITTTTTELTTTMSCSRKQHTVADISIAEDEKSGGENEENEAAAAATSSTTAAPSSTTDSGRGGGAERSGSLACSELSAETGLVASKRKAQKVDSRKITHKRRLSQLERAVTVDNPSSFLPGDSCKLPATREGLFSTGRSLDATTRHPLKSTNNSNNCPTNLAYFNAAVAAAAAAGGNADLHFEMKPLLSSRARSLSPLRSLSQAGRRQKLLLLQQHRSIPSEEAVLDAEQAEAIRATWRQANTKVAAYAPERCFAFFVLDRVLEVAPEMRALFGVEECYARAADVPPAHVFSRHVHLVNDLLELAVRNVDELEVELAPAMFAYGRRHYTAKLAEKFNEEVVRLFCTQVVCTVIDLLGDGQLTPTAVEAWVEMMRYLGSALLGGFEHERAAQHHQFGGGGGRKKLSLNSLVHAFLVV